MGTERAAAWLSRGFECLLHELDHGPRKGHVFDVVIVGSGYGGAVAAAELAGCVHGEDDAPVSVCVLERGKEYLPGMFPSRLADLPGHVRFGAAGAAQPRGKREGLFDVRVGPDVCALLANGLGGGSLINAGVMEIPDPRLFDGENSPWPSKFKDPAERDALYIEAKQRLGARLGDVENTVDPKTSPLKFQALQTLVGGEPVRPASITIAMTSRPNSAGVNLSACVRCGDCATGCNHGAKDSLDLNLLVVAKRRCAEIYTGATVLRLEREEDGEQLWRLIVVHTDEKLRAREDAPLRLRARKVVLAAGAFGSTEILLRSQSDALRFSRRLGQGFSANGDMIAAAYRQNIPVNAVADESVAHDQRDVGPTITGVVEIQRDGRRHVVEDLAIPGPLRRVFEEVVTTADRLQALGQMDRDDHDPDNPAQQHDPCAIDPGAICRTSILTVIGADGGQGSLELSGGAEDGDGAVSVRWPQLKYDPLFDSQIKLLRELVKGPAGGTVLPSPLWQLLPEEMQYLLGNDRGPFFTVHPLGGCPMAKEIGAGVVDDCGRVFDARSEVPGETLGGLVVLDGSIVPASLGTNPALTITALALNAVRNLRTRWGYKEPPPPGAAAPVARPIFRAPPTPVAPAATELHFLERMSGKAKLAGRKEPCVVELTLPFELKKISELVRPADGTRATMARTLVVDPSAELRVFDAGAWKRWREAGEPDNVIPEILARAPLTGTLRIFGREKKTKCQRIRVAFWAWVWNRGLRDIWQWIAERIERKGWLRFVFGDDEEEKRREDPSQDNFWNDIRRRYDGALALASRGGEVRRFDYRLTIGRPQENELGLPAGFVICGSKRLTYARRANPWRQLMRMKLEAFPGLARKEAMLDLDTKFLARKHVPLLCVARQHDQPTALMDLASLAAYFVRLVVNLHIWSFRRPDAPVPREPQRLPGIVPGLPAPQIRELDVDRLTGGEPVRVRLTRYQPPGAKGLPVALIPGYSTSGTAFAHPAVRPNLAEHLCGLGRDVWILDLRTSSGMPTARDPWSFEDAALADIPAAFAWIRKETGSEQLDVFAHCMGSAMLSMAVLKPPVPGERYYREREGLPSWIKRAVLSQIGPVMAMSPANVFRAYALGYLRYYLPLGGYDFRVKDDPGLVDQLIDRILATQPYPEEEFDIENPRWPCRRTPFAGTRHRMDALYGQDFRLADRDGARLDDAVLEQIDDLFGPLSIDTISQGLHLARLGTIATRDGRNDYVNRDNLQRWSFPTLSIHGERNGLADVATLARMKKLMEDAPCRFDHKPIPGMGHQDSLIGREACRVFEVVGKFLERGES